MSLPIVIIFERHWDTIPKSIVKELLPDLNKKGYQTFCFEAPQDLSPREIVDRHNSGLEFDTEVQQQAEQFLRRAGIITTLSEISFCNLAVLMRLFVSSKKYVDVAERLKQLPVSRILKESFDEAAALSMSLKGVDIDAKEFDEMLSSNVVRRMPLSGCRKSIELRPCFKT